MPNDIETLWALVAGLLLLFTNLGAVVMLEGLTRRRSALTVSARHLAALSGAVLGTVGAAALQSGRFAGSDIVTVDFGSSDQLWLATCTAILTTTLAMAGLAERSTVIANLLVGVAMGAVVVPLVASARIEDGLLASIEFGQASFIDTSAASLFALSGIAAFVGTTIIGPRRGRRGRDDAVRTIPGKSMPVAMVGGLLMIPAMIGALGRPGDEWNDEVLDAALGVLVGAGVGGVAGLVFGSVLVGRASLVPALHGALAGAVSTTGDPFGATRFSQGVVGFVGAILALSSARYLKRVDIDDPVGVVTTFGIAGLWGAIAVGIGSGDQFLAQLLGIFLIATFTIIVMGIIFAFLRILRLLRISTEIEVAGLTP